LKFILVSVFISFFNQSFFISISFSVVHYYFTGRSPKRSIVEMSPQAELYVRRLSRRRKGVDNKSKIGVVGGDEWLASLAAELVDLTARERTRSDGVGDRERWVSRPCPVRDSSLYLPFPPRREPACPSCTSCQLPSTLTSPTECFSPPIMSQAAQLSQRNRATLSVI